MTNTSEQDRIIASIRNDYPGSYTPEHVFLVGLQVRGETRAEAETNLTHFLPRPTTAEAVSPIECWWVAEDDRTDRSDNDSAIFVDPGAQPLASALLFSLGMSGSFNVVERKGGQFTGTYEPTNTSEPTRYQKARVIRDLMATLSIGMGDLDLIDALDSLVEGERLEHENPRIAPENVPAAFEALAPSGEYQWHGNQDDLWDRLRENTRDEVRDAGLLIEPDEDE